MSHSSQNDGQGLFSLGENLAPIMLVAGLVCALFVSLGLEQIRPNIYHTITHWHLPIVHWTLHYTAVDVGLTVFFFLVGLELSGDFKDRENGALTDMNKAALPVIGALGGILVPVAVYFAFQSVKQMLGGGAIDGNGFGVPMATDIVFVMLLAKLLNFAPAVRKFLLVLAVADDIVSILVIALWYNDGSTAVTLATLVGTFAAMYIMGGVLKVKQPIWYIVALAVLWVIFHHAHIHPTLAGVWVGVCVPLKGNAKEKSPLHTLEHLVKPLEPIVLFAFAFVSAGVTLQELTATDDLWLTASIAAGLLIGKPLGITSFTWLAWQVRPNMKEFSLRELWSAGALAGIGFTVALFVNGLAFTTAVKLAAGKLGVLIGSVLSGILGAFLQKSGKSSTH